jgi:hypothetical protein
MWTAAIVAAIVAGEIAFGVLLIFLTADKNPDRRIPPSAGVASHTKGPTWPATLFLAVITLLWSVGTCFLDAAVVAGFVEEGLSREPVFLLLFSLPFNAVLVALCGGIAASSLLGRMEISRFWAGVRVHDTGGRACFRLPRWSPAGVAFLAVLVGPILLTLVVGAATLGKPPLPPAIVALTLAVGGAVLAPAMAAKHIATGRFDFVIDHMHRTVALPLTFGRVERTLMPLGDLIAIDVAKEVKTDSEGSSSTVYAITARWRDRNGEMNDAKLVELNFEPFAEELAVLMREKAGLAQTGSLAATDLVGVHN